MQIMSEELCSDAWKTKTSQVISAHRDLDTSKHFWSVLRICCHMSEVRMHRSKPEKLNSDESKDTMSWDFTMVFYGIPISCAFATNMHQLSMPMSSTFGC